MNSRTLLFLLVLFSAAASALPPEEQRARFLRAYGEAKAGGPAATALATGLESYPLYPYLR